MPRKSPAAAVLLPLLSMNVGDCGGETIGFNKAAIEVTLSVGAGSSSNGCGV